MMFFQYYQSWLPPDELVCDGIRVLELVIKKDHKQETNYSKQLIFSIPFFDHY